VCVCVCVCVFGVCDICALRARALRVISRGACFPEAVVYCGRMFDNLGLQLQPEAKSAVLSERAAARQQRLKEVSEGQKAEGVVTTLTAFGAFVDLKCEDGKQHGVEGLIHISELSWKRIAHPSDVVAVGETVTVLVKTVDAEQGRIGLSLKRLTQDPLEETIESVVAGGEEDEEAAAALLAEPMPGLDAVVAELGKVEQVERVELGRRALEQTHVSQDLELWVKKGGSDAADAGYTLVARAGRQVQELRVATTLDKESFKQAILAVSAAVNRAATFDDDDDDDE